MFAGTGVSAWAYEESAMGDGVPTSRAGSQFGPYLLRRLIDRGVMGEAYEAEDTRRDRTVA